MRSRLRSAPWRAAASLMLVAAIGVACANPPAPAAAGIVAQEGDAALAADICANVDHDWLWRMGNAFRSDWSGDIQILPRYPNTVDGGHSHAGPWDHLQKVPLLIWGPGYVKPGVYREPTSVTDIAPTSAELVDFDFPAPNGHVLSEALVPADERPLPKLVVTMIWDSTGRNVLDENPDSWPYLASLIEDGAWFENTFVNVSNSNTPPGHAAIGTGAYAPVNGVIDEYVRIHGELERPGEGGPSLMLWPTFGDLYDLAMDNEPVVGGVATLSAHALMVSHGSMWNGGDRDIAVMRQQIDAATGGVEAVEWNLPNAMRLYFDFPAYANRVSSIDEFNQQLDEEDGTVDGNWRDHPIETLRNGFDTPARSPYQTQLVEAVVQREGFGADDVPDLLYLNYKGVDTTAHAFSMTEPEMEDTLVWQDRSLEDLVNFFDEQVGKGEWVMLLTSDHGSQYPADEIGGIAIDPNKMRDELYAAFDDDDDDRELFLVVRPTQTWVDHAELEENGHTVDEIATFIRGLTAGQVARNDFELAPGQEDDLVYETAFPSRIMGQLPCLKLQVGA